MSNKMRELLSALDTIGSEAAVLAASVARLQRLNTEAEQQSREVLELVESEQQQCRVMERKRADAEKQLVAMERRTRQLEEQAKALEELERQKTERIATLQGQLNELERKRAR